MTSPWHLLPPNGVVSGDRPADGKYSDDQRGFRVSWDAYDFLKTHPDFPIPESLFDPGCLDPAGRLRELIEAPVNERRFAA